MIIFLRAVSFLNPGFIHSIQIILSNSRAVRPIFYQTPMKSSHLLKLTLLLFIAGLFTSILNFSLIAEKDTVLSDLPVIPAPEDGRGNLYRLIQSRKQEVSTERPSNVRAGESRTVVFPEQKTDNEGLVASLVKETVSKGPKQKNEIKNASGSDEKPALEKQVKPKTEVKENQTPASLPVTAVRAKELERKKKEALRKKAEAGLPISLASSTGVRSFPSNLEPYKPRKYEYKAPDFYKGIYLTNYTARNAKRYESLIQKGKPLGMNALVVDVQPKVPPEAFIRYAKKNGMYLIARVVVFEGGLKKYPADITHINKILNQAEAAAKAGFPEIQLDYIRFADNLKIKGLTMDRRYRMIAGVLRMSEDRLRPYGVRIGADVFGRIAFNKSDIIGQQVELFSLYMDTLYPMLYPSHFYGDPHRRKDPYGTIYDGTKKSMKRSGNTRVIAYIQSFKMAVGVSGLGYTTYIRKQLEAAKDSGSAGYIAWNARNHYGAFFQAMKPAKK